MKYLASFLILFMMAASANAYRNGGIQKRSHNHHRIVTPTVPNVPPPTPDPVSLTTMPTSTQVKNALHDIVNHVSGDDTAAGVPTDYDWALNGRLGPTNGQPAGRPASIGWGQAFFSEHSPNIENASLMIRNMKTFVCHGSPHKWTLYSSGQIDGAQFQPDFSNQTQPNPAPTEWYKFDGVDDIQFQQGYAWHFWPIDGRFTLPTDGICGYLVVLEAKSDVENNFLMSMGADYWDSLTAEYINGNENIDVFTSRMIFVSESYQWFIGGFGSDADINLLYSNGYN